MSLIDDFLASRKAGPSRRSTRQNLVNIARWMGYDDIEAVPWHTFTRTEVQRVRAILADKVDADEYVPATANRQLDALRSLLKEAFEQGLTDATTYQRAVAVKYFAGDRLRAPRRVLTDAEALRLTLACQYDGTPRGRRDAALVALICNPAGLRAKEYADLNLADIDLDTGVLRVRLGKGDRERTIPLLGATVALLRLWLDARGDDPGPLLCRVGVGTPRRDVGQRLTPDGINAILRRIGDSARVPHFTCHATRRYAATAVARTTGSELLAGRLLGHSPKGTTGRYIAITTDDLRQAVQKSHVSPTWVQPTDEDVEIHQPPPVEDRLMATVKALAARPKGGA